MKRNASRKYRRPGSHGSGRVGDDVTGRGAGMRPFRTGGRRPFGRPFPCTDTLY